MFYDDTAMIKVLLDIGTETTWIGIGEDHGLG